MIYRQARWYFDPRGDWILTKAGDYEEGAAADVDLRLRMEDTHMLIAALDEQGWIKPRLDERLREEDLKITHRLIDLLEKKP